MNTLLRILLLLEKRIHLVASSDPRSLSIYRIVFSLYVLTFVSFNFSWIGYIPDIFFYPPYFSIANLFSGFPNPVFFKFIHFILVILFICLLFGYKTRTVSILASLLWIIAVSFNYSFGKIDHFILVFITPFLLSFSAWGNYYSIDSYSRIKTKKRSYGLSILALCICFGFFTAGLPKLFGWIDFDLETSGVRSWLNTTYYINNKQEYLSGYFIDLNNSLFWEIIDYTAVIFEVSFLAACFTTRRIFRSYLCLAVIFHFINLLMLNISFSSFIIIYAAFFDWHYYSEKINRYLRIKLDIKKNLSYCILIIILIIYTVLFFLGYKYTGLKKMIFPGFNEKIVILTLSSAVAFYYLLSGLYKLLQRK